jgi:C-terminal processing protease CtpA/Prc
MRLTRAVVKNGFGLELPFEPMVTVRRVKESKRLYYTDGEDKIYLDWPTEHHIARLQLGDERVVKYALPAYLQIWLFRSLTSTAGLDRRILESLVDYGMFLYKREVERLSPQLKAPEEPVGYGMCWHQLEQLYPGRVSFVLNNVGAEKGPAHLLGQRLRDLATAATEDPNVARLFDMISPVEPLLSARELTPSVPLVATSALRTGRLEMWNGVPLLDLAGDEMTAAQRINEFERVYLLAISRTPDNKVKREPPAVRDIDVWRLYFEFRPRILKARDNFDYYLVLREFCARFQDRSFGILPSPAVPVPPGSPYWSGIAGMKIERSAGRYYVARLAPDKAPAQAGLTPGLEITAIDGLPPQVVVDRFAEFTRTFDSCPSRHRAEAFALNAILSGPNESTCTLTLRDNTKPKDKAFDVQLKRGLPPDPKAPPPSVDFDPTRADGIGVVKVNNFGADCLPRFSAAFDEASKRGMKGMVIDLRGNEGVTMLEQKHRTSSAMLGRLLPVDSGKVVVGNAVRRVDEFLRHAATEIVIERLPGTAPWTGRACVLVDSWTGGEAEWFALGFQLAKLGLVVGQQTAGSVSAPKSFDPRLQSLTDSKLELSLPASAVFNPDGSVVQSIGIKPQVAVEPTPDDLRTGRDAILERAAALMLEAP